MPESLKPGVYIEEITSGARPIEGVKTSTPGSLDASRPASAAIGKVSSFDSENSQAGKDSEWKYVNLRRLILFIEQSLDQGLQWAVFEPNGPELWAAVTKAVQDLLLTIWKQGTLCGATPQQAFFVHCDQTTMTQADIDAGLVIADVGVAPLAPAEFTVLRIRCQTAPKR